MYEISIFTMLVVGFINSLIYFATFWHTDPEQDDGALVRWFFVKLDIEYTRIFGKFKLNI